MTDGRPWWRRLLWPVVMMTKGPVVVVAHLTMTRRTVKGVSVAIRDHSAHWTFGPGWGDPLNAFLRAYKPTMSYLETVALIERVGGEVCRCNAEAEWR